VSTLPVAQKSHSTIKIIFLIGILQDYENKQIGFGVLYVMVFIKVLKTA